MPLIADVHFSPAVAETAARVAEKIRINPGNYIDRKTGQTEFSEKDIRRIRDTIHGKLRPLVEICNNYGVSIRVGSNHGSLSDRMLAIYGNTPLGMVESTLEFVRIFEDLGFRELILSMKASSVQMMTEANRLLVQMMAAEGMSYPIHLGVTEAGDGGDGRVKSAAGSGILLLEGIGDTIRVSLTEPPENEIPVARKIVSPFNGLRNSSKKTVIEEPFEISAPARKRDFPGEIPGPVVMVTRTAITGQEEKKESAPDLVFVKSEEGSDFVKSLQNETQKWPPLLDMEEFTETASRTSAVFLEITPSETPDMLAGRLSQKRGPVALILDTGETGSVMHIRNYLRLLRASGIDDPVIVKRNYTPGTDEEILIRSSMEYGFLISQGDADGIWMEAEGSNSRFLASCSLSILQALGLRRVKTDFIACPSCGRTTFNIEQTLKKVRERTSHLPGIRIAVMGCIVNGPGEMADADYGYVGSGRGKVTLFRGRQIVKRNIPEEEALGELVELIRQGGDWIERG